MFKAETVWMLFEYEELSCLYHPQLSYYSESATGAQR